MQVRLLTSRVTLLGPAQREGDVIEVSDREGAALIGTRQAEYVEVAMVAPAETAARKLKPNRR